MVEPGSSFCSTCAYDPQTGDTALNPRRPDTTVPETSTAAIVVSGISVLVAIALVVFAVLFALQSYAVSRPSVTRTFATESGTSG